MLITSTVDNSWQPLPLPAELLGLSEVEQSVLWVIEPDPAQWSVHWLRERVGIAEDLAREAWLQAHREQSKIGCYKYLLYGFAAMKKDRLPTGQLQEMLKTKIEFDQLEFNAAVELVGEELGTAAAMLTGYMSMPTA